MVGCPRPEGSTWSPGSRPARTAQWTCASPCPGPEGRSVCAVRPPGGAAVASSVGEAVPLGLRLALSPLSPYR